MSIIPNIIGGEKVLSASKRVLPIVNPAAKQVIAEVPMSSGAELDRAVTEASRAQKEWEKVSVKERVQVFFRLKQLMEARQAELADLVTQENGKTHAESLGSIARAIECIEFAASLPQMATGQVLEVSKGVECKTRRVPLGVVAGITPFNFPLMVPMWMIPTAIASGNAFILKPSEQTPLSSLKLAELFEEAGLPKGVYSVVHGDKELVEEICVHPGISAIGFVGSSKVAEIVYQRGSAHGKRVRALGGAKNHLVLAPDADPEMAANNIVASVTGCAGQRCMAASVLLAVGEVDGILSLIKEKMQSIVPGEDIGPVINEAALSRIEGYLERSEQGSAKLLLDGRKAQKPAEGFFIGASLIDHASPEHESSCDEIFGPVLTVIRCKSLEEAIAIENQNPYGNAAAIYTSSGSAANYFAAQASAGMIGVNIGVPVPREPFAFGGWNTSLYGDGDITGPGSLDFWTKTKKITTKWSAEASTNWMS